MSTSQSSGIELKLTYNMYKNIPRNFFIHLYHVPLDAIVHIEYQGEEISVTNNKGYVNARFWIAQDDAVNITVLQNDAVVVSGTYLVHEDRVFAEAINFKRPDLIQITYMNGR